MQKKSDQQTLSCGNCATLTIAIPKIGNRENYSNKIVWRDGQRHEFSYLVIIFILAIIVVNKL